MVLAWLPRNDPDAKPGQLARAAGEKLPVPDTPCFAWVVGESSLPVSLRRHWVHAGIPKSQIIFCGYWRAAPTH